MQNDEDKPLFPQHDAAPHSGGRPSFAALLHQLAALDDAMTAGVDPAELVGDVRDKVDAIKQVIDRLEGLGDYYRNQVKTLAQAAASAELNADRLKAYVCREMEGNHFERLPGDTWRIQLQDSPEAMEVTREPTAEDFRDRQDLVEMKRFYVWKKDAVKARLQAGEELPFARIKRGKHVRFYLNKDTVKALKSKKTSAKEKA